MWDKSLREASYQFLRKKLQHARILLNAGDNGRLDLLLVHLSLPHLLQKQKIIIFIEFIEVHSNFHVYPQHIFTIKGGFHLKFFYSDRFVLHGDYARRHNILLAALDLTNHFNEIIDLLRLPINENVDFSRVFNRPMQAKQRCVIFRHISTTENKKVLFPC